MGQAQTPSPSTLPALASLLTGRTPARHGLYPGGRPAEGLEPLPLRLAANGYSLAIYGNLDVDGMTLDRLGLAAAASHLNPGLDAQGVVDLALAGEAQKLEKGSRLIWVHLHDLAAPYIPPLADLIEFHGDGYHRLWDFQLALSSEEGRPDTLPANAANGPLRRAAFYMDSYDAAARDIDRAVGRLADAWLPSVMAGGGAMLVGSLHGEALGEHGRWFSHGGTLYEEELRVPLLLFGDGLRGRLDEVASRRISLVDMAPTLLDLLGLEAPRRSMEDGANLVGFLRGSAPAPSRSLTSGLLVPPFSRALVAEGRMKIILTPPKPPLFLGQEEWPEHGRRELYDLETDPLEIRDQTAKRGDVSHALSVLLERQDPPWPGTPPAEDSSRRR